MNAILRKSLDLQIPPAAVAAYQRSGFVRGPKILKIDEVEHLKNEVERVIREYDQDKENQPVACRSLTDMENPVWQIINIWQASEAFKELMLSPTLVEWAASLTQAKELKLWHDQIQYKPSGVGGEISWYQDSSFWPALEPLDSMITAWIALDDAEPENGCMSMVPGSHKWGCAREDLEKIVDFTSLPETYLDHDVYPILCPVPAGYVHFHHPLTWHGSPVNKSNKPRRAIAIHFATENACLSREGQHVMRRFATCSPGEQLTGAPFISVYKCRSI